MLLNIFLKLSYNFIESPVFYNKSFIYFAKVILNTKIFS